jgi:hypothetical protein
MFGTVSMVYLSVLISSAVDRNVGLSLDLVKLKTNKWYFLQCLWEKNFSRKSMLVNGCVTPSKLYFSHGDKYISMSVLYLTNTLSLICTNTQWRNYLSWGAGNDQVFYCMRPTAECNRTLGHSQHLRINSFVYCIHTH